jgi:hypothetical protein
MSAAMIPASVAPHDISSTALNCGGIWKCMLSTRSGRDAASTSWLLGCEEEFVTISASTSALRNGRDAAVSVAREALRRAPLSTKTRLARGGFP